LIIRRYTKNSINPKTSPHSSKCLGCPISSKHIFWIQRSGRVVV